MSPRSVLVTGGAGYVGSVLVRQLLRTGHPVRVLDKGVYGWQALMTREVLEHDLFSCTAGDVLGDELDGLISASDVVVHLAGVVGDNAAEVDRAETHRANVEATEAVGRLAAEYGVRMIFSSSCSVYGQTTEEVDEESALNPQSYYAETKIASERFLLDHVEELTRLRFATIFGLGHRPRLDLVVNWLTARARTEGKVTIYNREQWRPFIHVFDVAEAIRMAVEGEMPGVFNVGDPALNHTLDELAEAVCDEVRGTEVEYVDNNDRRDYRVNFDRIAAHGFFASRSLEDGIREIAEAEWLKPAPVYDNEEWLQLKVAV